MKYIFTLFPCFFTLLQVSSQALERNVLGSGGGTVVVNGYTIHYTIGEPTAGQLLNSFLVITPGFQQPFMDNGKNGISVNTAILSGEMALNTIHLKWITPKETNSDKFVVEKGSDTLNNFKEIANLSTSVNNGNSTTPLTYSHIDNNNTANITYYRIKLLSKRGILSYSNIIAIVNTSLAWRLESIYPNPVKNTFNMQVFTKDPANTTISLMDYFGRIYTLNSTLLQKGMNNVSFDIGNLAKGIYYLRIQSNNDSRADLSGKIIKIE